MNLKIELSVFAITKSSNITIMSERIIFISSINFTIKVHRTHLFLYCNNSL
jgi:hypothetical protein